MTTMVGAVAKNPSWFVDMIKMDDEAHISIKYSHDVQMSTEIAYNT